MEYRIKERRKTGHTQDLAGKRLNMGPAQKADSAVSGETFHIPYSIFHILYSPPAAGKDFQCPRL
jgi:hypothetical protein